MKYKAVIFDMDGTTLDTLEDLLGALNHTLGRFGFPLHDLREMRGYVGNGIRRQIEQGAPAGTPAETIDRMLPVFMEYYKVHGAEHTHPYEGIPELLRHLRDRGIRTAIVSNKADVAVRRLTEVYFPGLFEVSVGEKEGVRRKPAPDSVLEVLRIMGLSVSDAVYVGDSEVDIQTADRAGMDRIIVGWGFRDREDLLRDGADRVFGSPREVEEYLLSD
ncbi:MAG: HAD-IA family hydrolase [Lachnospiraceae bacterium]|nr:HAD-IA family hydrolase [Lachnospiraceae bacterium]